MSIRDTNNSLATIYSNRLVDGWLLKHLTGLSFENNPGKVIRVKSDGSGYELWTIEWITGDRWETGLRWSYRWTGNGAPSNALWYDNDIYVDNVNWDYYQRITGSYVLKWSIKWPQWDEGPAGPTGPQWDTWLTGPQWDEGPVGPQWIQWDDGREVELQKSATHVQWRYVGDTSWTNLVALTDIAWATGATWATGPAGPTGPMWPAGVNGTNWINGTNGVNGIDGQDIDHVSLTSWTSAPGTTDTYTVWGDAGETINLWTFTVYNWDDWVWWWASIETSVAQVRSFI